MNKKFLKELQTEICELIFKRSKSMDSLNTSYLNDVIDDEELFEEAQGVFSEDSYGLPSDRVYEEYKSIKKAMKKEGNFNFEKFKNKSLLCKKLIEGMSEENKEDLEEYEFEEIAKESRKTLLQLERFLKFEIKLEKVQKKMKKYKRKVVSCPDLFELESKERKFVERYLSRKNKVKNKSRSHSI